MKYLSYLLLLFFAPNLYAQSPYELDWKKESIYLGIGAGTNIVGAVLGGKKFTTLTESDIFLLDRANVNSFDRKATFNFSSSAKKKSDILLIGSFVLPSLFLLDKRPRKDIGNILLLYGETYLITSGITSTTKRIAKRTRPFVYNEIVPLSDKLKNNARFSFFSGHSSSTAANSIFVAKVFSDYFPESKWKPLVWGTAILIPVATSHFRIKAGKHFRTDVIVGSLLGGAVGFLVPHLHRTKKKNSLSIYPTPSGFLLTKTF